MICGNQFLGRADRGFVGTRFLRHVRFEFQDRLILRIDSLQLLEEMIRCSQVSVAEESLLKGLPGNVKFSSALLNDCIGGSATSTLTDFISGSEGKMEFALTANCLAVCSSEYAGESTDSELG